MNFLEKTLRMVRHAWLPVAASVGIACGSTGPTPPPPPPPAPTISVGSVTPNPASVFEQGKFSVAVTGNYANCSDPRITLTYNGVPQTQQPSGSPYSLSFPDLTAIVGQTGLPVSATCGSASANMTGSVHVTVPVYHDVTINLVDEFGRAPISGAIVPIGSQRLATDANGTVVARVLEGELDLASVEKPGLEAVTRFERPNGNLLLYTFTTFADDQPFREDKKYSTGKIMVTGNMQINAFAIDQNKPPYHGQAYRHLNNASGGTPIMGDTVKIYIATNPDPQTNRVAMSDTVLVLWRAVQAHVAANPEVRKAHSHIILDEGANPPPAANNVILYYQTTLGRGPGVEANIAAFQRSNGGKAFVDRPMPMRIMLQEGYDLLFDSQVTTNRFDSCVFPSLQYSAGEVGGEPGTSCDAKFLALEPSPYDDAQFTITSRYKREAILRSENAEGRVRIMYLWPKRLP